MEWIILLVTFILCVPLVLMTVAGSCSDEIFEVIESVLNRLGGFGEWCFKKLKAYRTSKAGEREDLAYADSFKDGVNYTSKDISNGEERDVSSTHSIPFSKGGISNLLFFGALPMLCVVYWLWFFIFGPDVPIWDIQDISLTCSYSLIISAVLSGLGIIIGLLRIISPVRVSVPDPNNLSNKILVKSNPKVYKWVTKTCVVSLVGILFLFNSFGFGDVLIKDFGDFDSGLAKGSSIRFYPRSAGDALVDAFQYAASESKNEDNGQQKQEENSSLRDRIESIVKNKLGSQWYILNDKQAKWDNYDLENLIVPYRNENPDYPYIIKGDFDGNGKLDYAATFSESGDLVSKIAIIFDSGKVYFWDIEYPTLCMLDCEKKQDIYRLNYDSSVKLIGDGIAIFYSGEGGELICWDGTEFKVIFSYTA